jgi:hypothetical protein
MATGDSGYQGGGAVLLNNFYNTLRQDEFRRQQQDAQEAQLRNKAREQTAKDLEDVTSKLTSKGLRNQAEIDIYTKMYEDVKGYKAMVNSAETPAERAKYTVLAKDTARKAMDFVDGAEEFKKGELTIANKFQTDPFSFGEDQKTLYKTNLNKPYTELGVRFDPTPYSTRLKPEEVEKIITNRIGGLLEAQGNLLARTKQFTIGNNEGNLFYQDLTIAPQEAAKDMLKLLNTNIGFREHYERLYPNAKPEEIAINIVNERVDKLGNISKRDTTGSFVENNKPASAETKAESKKKEEISVRNLNLNKFVDEKDQTVFEDIKASLPPGSTLGWVVPPAVTAKMKAEGRTKARPDEIIGVRITVPTFLDKNSNRYDKINELIDFTKGDPKKRINTIINTYYGKNIENEDLGSTNRRTTTATPKAKPSAKPTVKVSKKADVL